MREPLARRGPGAPGLAALLERGDRRLGDRAPARRAAATARRRASRARSRSRRSPTSSRAAFARAGARGRRAMPPRAPSPVGVVLADKPPGPSSFALRRRRCAARTGARTGHAGTLDPFASGLLVLLSGARDAARALLRRARQALPHRRRPDARRPRPATPRASSLERHGAARPRRARGAARGACAARSSCRSRPPRRSRSAASAPTGSRGAGVAVEMPLRRSHGLRARAASPTTARRASARAARQLGHLRARDRDRARRPLHGAAAHRGRPLPRRGGRPRAPARRPRPRSRGCPREALARVPESVRARVLALEQQAPTAARAVRVARRPEELERRPRAVAVGTFDGLHLGHRAVDRRARRGRAAADRRHLPSPPARGARLRGRAARDARAPARAARRARRRRDARRRVHARGRRARARGLRPLLPRGDRRRARRRRRESFRFGARPPRRPRAARAARARDARRRRSSPASPRRASASSSRAGEVRRGRGAARPAGRGRGHRRLGRRARRHARLPDREPARRPRAARARASGSTRARRSATAPRSRSASTRTTAAPSGASRPSCSTSRATSTASGVVVELWERLRDEAVFASEAELVAQIARDVAADRAPRPRPEQAPARPPRRRGAPAVGTLEATATRPCASSLRGVLGRRRRSTRR